MGNTWKKRQVIPPLDHAGYYHVNLRIIPNDTSQHTCISATTGNYIQATHNEVHKHTKEQNCVVTLEKDTSNTETHQLLIYDKKHKLQRLTIAKQKFCGLEFGTCNLPRSRQSGLNRHGENHYLAVISTDETLLFITPGGNDLRMLFQDLSIQLQFVQGWTISALESRSKEDKCLLLLTKYHLSLATMDWHLSLEAWDLRNCTPSFRVAEDGTRTLILGIAPNVNINAEHQCRIFTTSRALDISNQIKRAKESLCPRQDYPLPPTPIQLQHILMRQPSVTDNVFEQVEEIYAYVSERCTMSISPNQAEDATPPPLPAKKLPRNFTMNLNKLAKQPNGKKYLHNSCRRAHKNLRASGLYQDDTNPLIPSAAAIDNLPSQGIPCAHGHCDPEDISLTLDAVLRDPFGCVESDTLQLSLTERKALCARLYSVDPETRVDWTQLAGEIGLDYEAVVLVKALVLNHMTRATAAEIVLIHWQHMHNRHYGTSDYKCEEPCTRIGLINLLKKIGRFDLVHMLGVEP